MISGIILCMRPANERRRYIVTIIGWPHTPNDLHDTEVTDACCLWNSCFEDSIGDCLCWWGYYCSYWYAPYVDICQFHYWWDSVKMMIKTDNHLLGEDSTMVVCKDHSLILIIFVTMVTGETPSKWRMFGWGVNLNIGPRRSSSRDLCYDLMW